MNVINTFYIGLCFSIAANTLCRTHAFTGTHLKLQLTKSRQITQFKQQPHKYSATQLYGYNKYDDGNKGISLKVLPVLVVGLFGLFGSDLINGFGEISGIVRQQSAPPAKLATLKEQSSEGKRGKLTRLTRKEINEKLAQVPLFFASTENGAVFIEDGKGLLFPEKSLAESYLNSIGKKESSLKVGATTMDQVFYPLIKKQQKLGSFIEGIAGVSDPNAQYLLQPSEDEVKQLPADWSSKHTNDLPMIRVEGLAFQKPEGLEIPVFLRKEDALLAYSRLREAKPAVKQDPELQIFSILDLIKLFDAGGFEGRAVEIYPSMDSVEAARTLLLMK